MERKDVKILIIDDMAYTRKSIERILVTNGFRESNIREAKDGVEALMICKSFNPDIAILDIMLPKINGLNLIGLLLSLNYKLKIIVCSVIKDTDVYKEALNKGAIAWIHKPVSEENLIPQIESVLKTESYLTQKDLANFVSKSYDYSEKFGIKLNSDKNLQIINVYGELNLDVFRDLKETVMSLLMYKYYNLILNLNGVTDLKIEPENFLKLKEIIEKNGKLKIISLKSEITEKLKEFLDTSYIVKTEAQAIKEI